MTLTFGKSEVKILGKLRRIWRSLRPKRPLSFSLRPSEPFRSKETSQSHGYTFEQSDKAIMVIA